MKFNNVSLTLILSLIFIYLIPFIKILNNYYIYSLSGFLLVLYCLACLRKNKLDKIITGYLFLIFLLSKIMFNNVDEKILVLRVSSITSFLLLNLVLLIGPWTRFKPKLIKYYSYRRHLGVSVLLLGLLHASIVIKEYFKYDINYIYQSSFTFFGTTSLFIFILMGLTSWDYTQKHFSLKTWKIIHFLSLLIYLSMIYIFYKINNNLNAYEIIYLITFVVYWIFAAPYSVAKLIIREVNGWKQLHVLVYIAYFSLIIHIYDGVLKSQQLWMKILFFVIILFVIFSHLIGWIVKWKEDKKITVKTDDEFVKLDKAENFEEGKGRKFIIDDKEIAVFKHQNNFVAVSNVCRHQKGPIYQGKIVNNYVYCPWHYWSYNLKDGCSNYGDCLPYYKTKVENGFVYVSKNPKEKI